MQRILSIIVAICFCLSLVACGTSGAPSPPNDGNTVNRQYITADQLKAEIEAEKDIFLLDIQAEENFNKNHLKGAVSTFAFPVETDEQKAAVSAVLGAAKDKSLIIICPGGKSGANNTWDYLTSINYDMSSVYILENGQNGWPYPELLASGDPEPSNIDAEHIDPVAQSTVFVTPQWVKSVMDGNQPESKNYVIIEASWGSADDSPDYKSEHIPSAVHADISEIEGEPYWNLNEPDVIEKAILNLGVTKDTTVIFYGLDSGTTRMAFAYLWAGVENVKVLNGGINLWKEAGYETESGENLPDPKVSFEATVPVHPEYWLSIEDAKYKLENDDNFRLVSIRSKAEYDGTTSGYSYIDRAGEPKGAVWGHAGSDPYHMEDYTNPDGTYINIEQAKALWDGYDISVENELSFYCGTGWRATIPWLLCYEAGIANATLYDGGWYQWQMNDDFPVQIGDPASGNVIYTTVGELSTDMAVK